MDIILDIVRFVFWKDFIFALAASLEEQQIPDSEQTPASTAGEERHAGDAGHGRKRGLLVLHTALLQAALHRRQRESRRLCIRGANVRETALEEDIFI